MPTATAARRRKGAEPVILDPAAVSEFVNEPASQVSLFNPFEDKIPFFDSLAMITPAEWEKYLVYIYRLDPKVRNPEGERAYIDKMQRSFDEGDIKAIHGGGKFMAILKDDVLRVPDAPGPEPRKRTHHFRIAGEPILQSGQTMVAPPQPGGVLQLSAPASDTPEQPRAGSSDVAVLASVLKDLIENRQNGAPGSSQAMELAGQAYKTGLTIVSEAARQTVQTSTGSAMGDKLLERLLDSKFGGKSGDSDLRDKLAMIALERLQNPQPAEGRDPLGQLSFVKELLGVDSIADLIRPSSGGDAWKSRIVDLGANFVTALPQLVQMFMASQERQFQRQLQLEALKRNGGAAPETPPSAAARIQVQAGPVVPPGAPAAPAPGEVPMPLFNPAQMALEEIVVDFENGLDGQVTARLVRQKFPVVIEGMKPMLGDLEQVKLFAQNTAPLNQVAGDEEFPQFLTEFVNEVLNPATDDGDEKQPA